jgi:hypothetical protein
MKSYKVIAEFSNVAIRVPELGAPWRVGSVNKDGQVEQFGHNLIDAVVSGLKGGDRIFFQTGQPLKNKIILNKFFYFNLDKVENAIESANHSEGQYIGIQDLIEDFGKTINARIEIFETYIPSKEASFISINIFKENGMPTHELKIHDDPRDESSFEILGSGQFLNIVPIKIKAKAVA